MASIRLQRTNAKGVCLTLCRQAMVEWFVHIVEERKKNQDTSKEKKNW